MHIVIKATKTIEEYKRLKARMEELAGIASDRHMKTVENWKHGEIKKVWFDHDDNLCIEYADGAYWHYNERGDWW